MSTQTLVTSRRSNRIATVAYIASMTALAIFGMVLPIIFMANGKPFEPWIMFAVLGAFIGGWASSEWHDKIAANILRLNKEAGINV